MIEDDEVIREVRAAREAFAASHGYNVRAMVLALRNMNDDSGAPVVSFAHFQPEVQLPITIPSVVTPSNGVALTETLPALGLATSPPTAASG